MKLDSCHIDHLFFFFSSRRRHTRLQGDWSSDVCSSDLSGLAAQGEKFGVEQLIPPPPEDENGLAAVLWAAGELLANPDIPQIAPRAMRFRSEERRVGKECRSRWSPYH